MCQFCKKDNEKAMPRDIAESFIKDMENLVSKYEYEHGDVFKENVTATVLLSTKNHNEESGRSEQFYFVGSIPGSLDVMAELGTQIIKQYDEDNKDSTVEMDDFIGMITAVAKKMIERACVRFQTRDEERMPI